MLVLFLVSLVSSIAIYALTGSAMSSLAVWLIIGLVGISLVSNDSVSLV